MIHTKPFKCSKSLWLATVIAAGILSAFSSGYSQVPWPEKMQNLKDLPKSTTTDELRTTMFAFSNALGVNCVHCHAAENWRDFSTYDFASDTKENKISARTMMRMVKEINEKQLTKLAGHKTSTLSVDCMTCHGGREKPITLEQEMSSILEKDGLVAAIEKYRALREKHYGGGGYDFSQNSLNSLGYQLLGKEQLKDAIAIFQLNVEMNPAAANPYDSLAEAYRKNGQNWLAFINYSKALELDPQNKNAEKMLNELKGVLNND